MSTCNRCTLQRIREREEGHIEILPARMPSWPNAIEVRRPGAVGEEGVLAWLAEVGESCECSWPEDYV